MAFFTLLSPQVFDGKMGRIGITVQRDATPARGGWADWDLQGVVYIVK
jgi:hypothetical protein